MASTFFGLEIGSRSLAASQAALDVIGHNTSNVNTPGYSRETVTLQATDPYSGSVYGQVGTGVEIGSVSRIRDDFTDKQTYDANAKQGNYSALSDSLSRIEQVYTEPGSSGIGSQLTAFFNSFSTLAANPSSQALRSSVRNAAQSAVSAFNSVSGNLSQIAPNIASQIQGKIKDANTLAAQIGGLNQQIRIALASGQHPNDLQDQRGTLISQLSGIVQIKTTDVTNSATGQPTGEVNINVAGVSLVQGNLVSPLPTTVSTQKGATALINANGDAINLTGGSLTGLLQAGNLLTGYQQNLDTLASSFVSAVNAQQAAGVDLTGAAGQPIFSGTDAASIAISSPIQNDLNAIAAAAAPIPPALFATGNGDNARALASIANKISVGGSTLNEYYNNGVAQVGADAKSASRSASNQQQVVSQLQNQQSSVSGVNLDEELTKLLQYQRSYQASAKIVNTFDDVLDRIINYLVK